MMLFKRKNQFLFLALSLLISGFLACKKSNPSNEKDTFIRNLISQMTLEEKLGQMNLLASGDIVTGQIGSSDIAQKIRKGQVGGLFNIKSIEKITEIQRIAVEESRLKIPLLFGMDVIHGFETTFPIPLGLSCSWDTALVRLSAQVAAEEAGTSGINWTFSPMVDLSREPRWGRVAEGSGEDPYLGGAVAKAMVIGYQGKDLSKANTLLSCVKHFALYGAPEAGKDYNTVDMSRVRMYNEYFPPYKAAIDAGVGSVMASFNELDGIPATGNRWLLTHVLRDEWRFKGFVVSDYTGINEMIAHGMGDLKEVSALAANAGLNMDMVGEGFVSTLKSSIEEGIVDLAKIDQSVYLILSAKYDLGLFEDPYRYLDAKAAQSKVFSKKNRAKARKVAAESMVLLKNESQILPLELGQKIAVIGPLAHSRENMAGTWSVSTPLEKCVSLLDGIYNAIGDSSQVFYAKGSNLVDDSVLEANATMFGRSLGRLSHLSNEKMIEEAIAVAQKADVIIAALGESSEMSGESSSRSNIELPEVQKQLLDALLATGKPVVMVLFTGRPLVIEEEVHKVPALLNAWFSGSEAGDAIADVLFAKSVPSGKLTMTFPRSVGQIPIYYNHKNTGRPKENPQGEFEKFRSNYLDISNEPLFPFGSGLSYTEFKYDNLKVSKTKFDKQDTLFVSLDVQNLGNFDAKEIVQLYIRDKVGSITRPIKELKGFTKVFIPKGEKVKVTFKITEKDLRFYNSDLKWVSEAGEFDIMVGPDSQQLQSISVNLL